MIITAIGERQDEKRGKARKNADFEGAVFADAEWARVPEIASGKDGGAYRFRR
jgi:hypothetical protein